MAIAAAVFKLQQAGGMFVDIPLSQCFMWPTVAIDKGPGSSLLALVVTGGNHGYSNVTRWLESNVAGRIQC